MSSRGLASRVSLAAIVVTVFGMWPVTSSAQAPTPDPVPGPGRELFVSNCASCHGVDATGTSDGPPIAGVGAAMVDFQLRTGRMPLADPGVQPRRKPPAFERAEIDALVDYVTSLGPPRPGAAAIPLVDPESGDLSLGQQLFVANCAPCHGATATGGAVGKGSLAPSLSLAAPVEIAEAMVVGPGQMPVFAFDQHERDSIVAFLTYLEERPDRGGADIGGVGPVPEGFVAWGLGMGSLFAIAMLVGHRRKRAPGERT